MGQGKGKAVKYPQNTYSKNHIQQDSGCTSVCLIKIMFISVDFGWEVVHTDRNKCVQQNSWC